jgi:hypothetical protein
MSSASVTNLFGTVVHSADPAGAAVTNLFSTVVHGADPAGAAVTNLFSTVVHNVLPAGTAVTNLFSTVSHEGPTFSVSDITGTVGITASFDASSQGFSTGSTSYQWSWSSVPPGSTMTNAILPLPDSGSTYPVSGNVGLWHFDSESSSSLPVPPTSSIGLVDSWGDGWHGNNFINLSINGAPTLINITLPGGTGPLWFDYPVVAGDIISITYTAGSFPNECSYILNNGAAGSGVDFFTSNSPPITPYSYTVSSITTYETPDSSGQGNNATPDGVTLISSSYVGSHCYEFDGVDDSIDLGIVPSDIGINGGNSRTIAFWASASAWSNDTAMFSMGVNSSAQDFTLLQKTPSNMQLNLWGGDLSVTANSTTGWNHYFIIYDADDTTSYIYQNNELLGSLDRVLNTSDASSIRLGNANHTWSSNFFSGKIDEFAIWNKALSACERSTIYNFLQTGSIDAASGSSPNLLEQFSFVPDVTGTYSIDLEMMDTNNCTSLTGTVDAVISPVPPTSSATEFILYSSFSEIAWVYDSSSTSVATTSSTSIPPLLPQSNGGPYDRAQITLINSYKALSPERVRRVDQSAV